MVSQIDLVLAITKHLNEDQKVTDLNARQMNAIVDAANRIVDEFAKPTILATDGMGLKRWLASDDTGMSSKYMAHVLGGAPQVKNNHPRDPDDFGRCVRLLDAVPELRAKLPMLAAIGHGPVWNALSTKWPILEVWYREDLPKGESDRLYCYIKSIDN